MENNTNKTVDVEILEKDVLLTRIEDYQKKLDALRANGVTLIDQLKNENSNIKTNKQLTKDQKTELVGANNTRIAEATTVKQQNAAEIKTLVAESVKLLKTNFKVYLREL